MSHEGIRFLDPEQARAAEKLDRRLPPDAVTPLKVRVMKTEGTGVEIGRRDGHRSAWTFRWLRDACPCATCNEERESAGRAPGQSKPRKSERADPFALYEEPPAPLDVTPIGKYALKFRWNDSHESGIYSWDYLRRICQCEACAASAR